MFYGLGEMTDAMERGREKRDAKRLENARLYKEFVNSNPGATPQERLDFANNLIKTTGAGSAGLPTKVQMERNYEKYQAEQRRAAAARAQAEKRRELEERRVAFRDALQIGEVMSSQFGSPGFDDIVKEQAEAFGIPEALYPLITKQAGDEAYQSWAKNNQVAIQAYLNNPTRAGYEGLTTGPGASIFSDRLSGAYEGAYKTAESRQAVDLNNTILNLAQTANPSDWERELQNALRGVPEAVKGQLDLGTYNEVVARRQAEARTAASQTALSGYTSFLRQQGSSITQEVADAKKAELIAAAAATGVTLDEGDFASTDIQLRENLQQGATIRQNAVNSAIRSADGLLAEVLDGSKTEEQALAALQVGALSQIAPGYQMSGRDTQVFQQALEQLRSRRAEVTGRATDVAVNNADLGGVARGNQTFSQAKTGLEAALSQQLGYDVTLSTEQEAALRTQLDQATTSLAQGLRNAATIASNDPTVIDRTAEQTRENFIEQFVAQVSEQQDINSDDAALRGKLEDLANSTYDRIFLEIRSQANEKEEDTIRQAMLEINAPTLPSADVLDRVREVIEGSVELTAMLGDGTDDGAVSAGILKAEIGATVTPMLSDIAATYGIPLTPELAVKVMDQYKTSNLSIGEQTNFVPGQSIDRSSINSAFEEVLADYMLSANAQSLPHGPLRLQALAAGLEAAGAGSLTEMTTEQRAVFDGFYRSSVERLVREKYDVLADTQMEDLAPTQALVQSTEASLSASQAAMREFTSFASSGDFQNKDAAPYDAALASKQSIESVIPSINNEISRLTRLMANDIYKPNPTQKAEIERQIAVLQDRRSSMQGLLRQYDAGYQMLVAANNARNAELEEAASARKEILAQQGMGVGMPGNLSPEAQESSLEEIRRYLESTNQDYPGVLSTPF